MKDEEKSRTGNHAKADSGSGPEEEKNNETKGCPTMNRKRNLAMNWRRAKRAGVWLWVSVWGLFSVWFLEKPYSETWAQALP